jgi:hypothetical protein
MCFKQITSLFFALTTSVCLWTTSIVAADFSTEEASLAGLTQEEFEQLKKDKTKEIWLSEEIDYATRFAYMKTGVASGILRVLIDKAWPEFYATHKDPSGKDWTLGEGQLYDLDGNIVDIVDNV